MGNWKHDRMGRASALEIAWRNAGPGVTLLGATVDHLSERMRAVQQIEHEIRKAECHLRTLKMRHKELCAAVNALALQFINAIRAHPDYGENSVFYASIGYKTKAERYRQSHQRTARLAHLTRLPTPPALEPPPILALTADDPKKR